MYCSMSVCLLSSDTNPLSLTTSWGHRKGDYCHNCTNYRFIGFPLIDMTPDNDLYVTTNKTLFVTTAPRLLNINLCLSLFFT